MRTLTVLALFGLLLGASAPVGADNVFGDPVCMEGFVCAPTSVCTSGLVEGLGAFCQSTTCDPATVCTADIHDRSACARNATIDGETCTQTTGADASVGGSTHNLPAGVRVIVPETSVSVALDQTNGHVRNESLVNNWTSDSVSASIVLLGVDLGTLRVAVYQSHITTDGDSGNDRHVWHHTVVSVSQTGPAGGAASVGAWRVDDMLEDCTVRAGAELESERTCKDTLETLP